MEQRLSKSQEENQAKRNASVNLKFTLKVKQKEICSARSAPIDPSYGHES